MKYSQVKQVIEFCNGLFSQPDVRQVITEAELSDDFDVDGVRFISSDSIDKIWTESLIEMIKDCYDLSDVPDFVAIDWEETAENCKVDGMGHHFNSYDGGEEEVTINGTLYHVFDNH